MSIYDFLKGDKRTIDIDDLKASERDKDLYKSTRNKSNIDRNDFLKMASGLIENNQGKSNSDDGYSNSGKFREKRESGMDGSGSGSGIGSGFILKN